MFHVQCIGDASRTQRAGFSNPGQAEQAVAAKGLHSRASTHYAKKKCKEKSDRVHSLADRLRKKLT